MHTTGLGFSSLGVDFEPNRTWKWRNSSSVSSSLLIKHFQGNKIQLHFDLLTFVKLMVPSPIFVEICTWQWRGNVVKFANTHSLDNNMNTFVFIMHKWSLRSLRACILWVCPSSLKCRFSNYLQLRLNWCRLHCRAGKTELLSDDLQEIDRHVEFLKNACTNANKKLIACLLGQGSDDSSKEKRYVSEREWVNRKLYVLFQMRTDYFIYRRYNIYGNYVLHTHPFFIWSI